MGNLFFADPEVYARDTHTPHLWTGDRMNSYCKCCSLIMVQCSSRRPTRVHFLRSYFACHILLLIFLADHHPHTAVVHTVFKLSTHDLSSNKILQIVDTLIRPPEQSHSCFAPAYSVGTLHGPHSENSIKCTRAGVPIIGMFLKMFK